MEGVLISTCGMWSARACLQRHCRHGTFSWAASLCPCRLQRGTDGAHGHGEAVGAVGAIFHVEKCAQWTVVGARATWATWTERPGNMNSGVHRVDMAIWAPRRAISAHRRRLDVSPRCIPSIPTLLP